MILLVTLLQLIWLSLSSAFLIFWLIYFAYLKLNPKVRKLNKKRQKKLINIAKFWLRRAVGLLLTNGIIFLVFNVA
tara:strand:- start:71 stop:298 length:228 start_codon:yes stop_codon:yes gene_type:complete